MEQKKLIITIFVIFVIGTISAIALLAVPNAVADTQPESPKTICHAQSERSSTNTEATQNIHAATIGYVSSIEAARTPGLYARYIRLHYCMAPHKESYHFPQAENISI